MTSRLAEEGISSGAFFRFVRDECRGMMMKRKRRSVSAQLSALSLREDTTRFKHQGVERFGVTTACIPVY